MKIINFKSLREVSILVTAEVDDMSSKGGRITKSKEVSFCIADCESEKAIQIALSQIGDLDQIFFDAWDRRYSLNPIFVSKEVVEITRTPHISAGKPILVPE